MIDPVVLGDCTLYCGDCLEILPQLEAGSVDAVISDYPYANNTDYKSYQDGIENLRNLINTSIPHLRRIADRIAIFTGVANIYLYPQSTWILSWVNTAGIGSSKWGFSCWQPLLVYGKDPYLQDGKGRRPDTLLQMKNEVDRNEHPCPKPTNVIRWAIERITRPNEIILDNCMGSGTTGVACVQTGRRFIGIEIDPTYFEIAVKRIKEAQLQMRMPI